MIKEEEIKIINPRFENHPIVRKINYMYNNGAISLKNYWMILEEGGFVLK
ncbi:MAG: hypothetical protein M0R03_23870 [Novosphingobium sp.]|nr:hypothetical protein [Novosphingobium sp.]